MKRIVFLLLLLVLQKAFSQTPITIQGQVTDQSTTKPLAYVSLYVAGTSFGTVTNRAGNFIFKYQPSGKTDSAVFSCIGYKTLRMSLKNVTGEFLRVILEPQPITMQEVVIKPLNPVAIVLDCLNKIPQNYNLKAHAVQGFQREYVKQGADYLQLLEVTFATNSEKTGHAPSSKVREARYLEDKKEKAPLWSTSRGGFYTFGWTAISGIENPDKSNFLGVNLNKSSDVAKYYEFQLKEVTRLNNQEIYVIAFDQKQSVKRPLLKGLLYIDSESGALVKLTYELSPRGVKHLKPHETWGNQKVSKAPKKISIKKDRYDITYQKYGSKWYLNTCIIDTEFDASLVFFGLVQAQKSALRFHSERLVTAVDTASVIITNLSTNVADVGSIPTLQNFIKKNYEKYEAANEEKWTNINFIQADTSVAAVAQQLKLKNQQWELNSRQQTLEKALTRSNYTARQLTEDVDYLQETLEKVHPGLYWYTNKATMDKAFKTIKDKLGKRNTETAFFQLLSPAIAQIHCGHTTVHSSVVKTEYQQVYTKLFPLNLYINRDSAVVLTPYESVPEGARVLAINGYEMPEIVERIKTSIASDGFNVTYKTFLLNTDFATLFSQHFAPKDTFDIKIIDLAGQTKNLNVVGKTNKDAASEQEKPTTLVLKDSLQTAILTIPSFSGTPDLPTFLQQAFAEIKSKNLANLVIDLRNNQGGRDEYGSLLYSYLAQKPFSYYQNITVATRDTTVLNRLYFGEVPFNAALPDYISGVKEENNSFLYTAHANLGSHQPNQNAFNGAVYILTNGGTFSTATEFAAVAHSSQRAVFIGEETGGGYYGNCSLGTPTLTLPHSQIRITIPLAKYQLAVAKNSPVGRGVLPDHPVTYNAQDKLQQIDKELALCLRFIRQGKRLEK